MNQRDIQKLIDKAEIIDDRNLHTHEQMALEALLESEGFPVLIGLLAGARQGFYVQLSGYPLSTEPGRYNAAVLQGQIKGIDLLPQIILDLFPPAGADV